jgi:hypothetical protein
MKYIKKYELKEIIFFWKVRIDEPYLEASLIKLNIPKHQINSFLRNENLKDSPYNKVYVRPIDSNFSHLSWNSNNKYGREGYERDVYIYGGEIKLTLEEAMMIIDTQKYNI